MIEFIDIVLLSNKKFCKAPPWSMQEGDYVFLPEWMGYSNEPVKVIAVTTESKDSKLIEMLEKASSPCPLPKIEEKFRVQRVYWGDETDEHTGPAE